MTNFSVEEFDLKEPVWPTHAQERFSEEVRLYADKIRLVAEYEAIDNKYTDSVTAQLVTGAAHSLSNKKGYELLSAFAGSLVAFAVSGFWALAVSKDANGWLYVVAGLAGVSGLTLLVLQKDRFMVQVGDMLRAARAAHVALKRDEHPAVEPKGGGT